MADYPDPVAKLLKLGDTGFGEDWSRYERMGFTAEHVPDLARMAADRDLLEAEDANKAWAPLHAWRTLGVLRAGEAVEALLQALRTDLELYGDAAAEEMPLVFE